MNYSVVLVSIQRNILAELVALISTETRFVASLQYAFNTLSINGETKIVISLIEIHCRCCKISCK